ncbi:MAG: hypothetical protein AAGB46_05965 [Verrucomicrobiota bacterium]
MSFIKGLTKFLTPSETQKYSTLSDESLNPAPDEALHLNKKSAKTDGSLKARLCKWTEERLGTLGYSAEFNVDPGEAHSPLVAEEELSALIEDLADDLQETIRSTRRIHSVKATINVAKGQTSITFECLGQFENSLLEYAEQQRLQAIEKRYRKNNSLKFEIKQASYFVALTVHIIEKDNRLGFSARPETEEEDDDDY